jgi:hypothetical protein
VNLFKSSHGWWWASAPSRRPVEEAETILFADDDTIRERIAGLKGR